MQFLEIGNIFFCVVERVEQRRHITHILLGNIKEIERPIKKYLF